ncbi:MAG: hypothetical protein V1838_03080 [Patescibacteria group bacterium]
MKPQAMLLAVVAIIALGLLAIYSDQYSVASSTNVIPIESLDHYQRALDGIRQASLSDKLPLERITIRIRYRGVFKVTPVSLADTLSGYCQRWENDIARYSPEQLVKYQRCLAGLCLAHDDLITANDAASQRIALARLYCLVDSLSTELIFLKQSVTMYGL